MGHGGQARVRGIATAAVAVLTLSTSSLAVLDRPPAAPPVKAVASGAPVRKVPPVPALVVPGSEDLAPHRVVPSRLDRVARAIVGPDVPAERVLQVARGQLAAVSILHDGPDVTGASFLDVAAGLGVVHAGGLDREAWGARVAAAHRRARPLLAAAGIEQPSRLTRGHLEAAHEAYALDFGTSYDPGDLERLRAAVRADLADLNTAASSTDDPATLDGLHALLTVLGVDFGTVVDAPDVANARGRAGALLLAAREAAAAAETSARAVEASAPPPPAPAPEPSPAPAPVPDWREVHGSLVHRTFSLPGPVQAQVLRWRLDDPTLRLTTDYAVDPSRRGSVPEAASRHGAVAAINGGFWVGENDPDGLLVRNGFLLSDTTANTDGHRNIRSGFGLRGASPVVGVPHWNASVTIADTTLSVGGVSRGVHREAEVLLTAPGAGGDPIGRPGTALRVPAVDLTTAGNHVLPVLERRDGGSLPSTDDTMVVWVDPARHTVPADVTDVTLAVGIPPEWRDLDDGMSAGPLLLRGGEGVGVDQWRSEGFSTSHTDVRHPRSAIGFTADGHGILVAIEGRQPGRSEGFTHTEVARFMQGLGVTDAVMLDGGGSSQLVVEGALANTPCCDAPLRPVSTVVMLVPR